MARESLDPGSRNWNIVTPLASDGIMAPDNSGYGANEIESNARVSSNGASAGWENVLGHRGPAPTYPNAWVRLKRTGQVISAYYSTNGINWTLTGTNDVTQVGDMTPLPDVIYVGMCTTAHNNDDPSLVPPYLYRNVVEYADYNSNFVPVALPTLRVTVSAGNLEISWTPTSGHLESSPTLGSGAVWTSAGSTNPATIPITGNAQFFRVVLP